MAEFDFQIARLHGIHAASFLGDRLARLSGAASLGQLWRELLPGEAAPPTDPVPPGVVEHAFRRRIVACIAALPRHFRNRIAILDALALRDEIDNVKLLLKGPRAPGSGSVELAATRLPRAPSRATLAAGERADPEAVRRVLRGTVFRFLADRAGEAADLTGLENELDRFYYAGLVRALEGCTAHEQEKLRPLLVREMNWRNIAWTLRLAHHYRRPFPAIADTLLAGPGLIARARLAPLAEPDAGRGGAEAAGRGLPGRYRDLLGRAVDAGGALSLVQLEERVDEDRTAAYARLFRDEHRNVLPLVAFIHLKRAEYRAVTRVIETVRRRGGGEA